MNQKFDITGKVIDLSLPFDMPGKDYSLMYITVEIENDHWKFENDKKGYYTFQYFRFDGHKKIKITVGDYISCSLIRSSNIWQKDGKWKIRDEIKTIQGERVIVGNHPIILDSYTVSGSITKENKPKEIMDTEPPYYPDAQNVDTIPEGYNDDLPF